MEAVSDRIVQEIFIEAPPERVFTALTTPEQLLEWWGDDEIYRCTEWTSDLKIGGHWTAKGASKTGRPLIVEGEYQEINPPHTLVYTWKPSWHNINARVQWTLTPQGNGTLLSLAFSGFEGNEEARRDHQGGSAHVLVWLKMYLTGKAGAPA
jgi:uncharacterized protein YndB with AHSA1/START domain